MKRLLKTMLCLSALIAPLAQAGSPGGLELIALGSSKALPYAPAVADYFRRVDSDAGASDCENRMLTVDQVRYQKARVGTTDISSQLMLEAVFSKPKRKQLAAALSAFRAKDVERGFDGALVYDVVGSDLVWYGVSANPDRRVFTARVPVAELDNKAKVNAALCHILVNIPVQAEP